jgi:hypothetical protein
MPAILTAEDVVRRNALDCAHVDERGGRHPAGAGGDDRAA